MDWVAEALNKTLHSALNSAVLAALISLLATGRLPRQARNHGGEEIHDLLQRELSEMRNHARDLNRRIAHIEASHRILSDRVNMIEDGLSEC